MSFIKRWLAEPLSRFLLIALLLLAADHLFNRATDGRAPIVVSASRKQALTEAFTAEYGRAPRADELQTRLDRWIDEQVLYREALALGLDRHDSIVQRQLTQKMRFLLEDVTLLPEPTTAELQSWLDRHPERYGHAATLSFDQVFLSRGRHGARLGAQATRVRQRLQRDPSAYVGLGDAFPTGQRIKNADAAQLRRDFGSDFAAAVETLTPGVWSVPITSSFGLHLVRVTAREGFRPAALEEVNPRVRTDYQIAQREDHNRRAIAELRARYRVLVEGGTR
ncbi:MAG: peptidylprolyl isomerase [Pseudomonadota bacterium]